MYCRDKYTLVTKHGTTTFIVNSAYKFCIQKILSWRNITRKRFDCPFKIKLVARRHIVHFKTILLKERINQKLQKFAVNNLRTKKAYDIGNSIFRTVRKLVPNRTRLPDANTWFLRGSSFQAEIITSIISPSSSPNSSKALTKSLPLNWVSIESPKEST